MEVVIGLDMGASKTSCVVADLKAKPLSHALSGPSNLNTCGIDGFQAALRKALCEALSPLAPLNPAVLAVGLGVAGLEGFQEREPVKRALKAVLKGHNPAIIIETDASMALLGALGKKPGILVLAGTGSIALGRSEAGEVMRVGGYGYLLGDEGSGFELGQRGIRAALRSLDGTGPETELLSALKSCYGLENHTDILPLVYKSPSCVETIARFAVRVLDLGFKGDSLAEGIVRDAIESLVIMTQALADKLRLTQPFALATSGGLFQNKAFLMAFLKSLESRVSQAKHTTPTRSPQMAAALLALEVIGIRL